MHLYFKGGWQNWNLESKSNSYCSIDKAVGCVCVCVCVVLLFLCVCICLAAQSCLTLCDPMDCSPPCSSVHGILQARILEWIAMPFSRGSFWPKDWTQVFCVAGRFITICAIVLPPLKLLQPIKSSERKSQKTIWKF